MGQIFGLPWPAFLAFAAQIALVLGSFVWAGCFDKISERPFYKPMKDLERSEER